MSRRAESPAAELDPIEDDLMVDMDGAELIPPRVDLRHKARERRRRSGQSDPVAVAEETLKMLEGSFAQWIVEESDLLVETWHAAEAGGYEAELRKDLFRCAHDIKGQAATLGYPFAGLVAASLCRLVDENYAADDMRHELIRQHVFAVRAIVNENARAETNALARKLVDSLDDVTTFYLDNAA